MNVLIADASVLIDLEKASLLRAAFALPYILVVPDLLYIKELEPYGGQQLRDLGLQITELCKEGVSLATQYRTRYPISIYDSFAIATAKLGEHTLLTGDKHLRQLSAEEKVGYHGVLWVFDQIEEAGLETLGTLKAALSTLSADRNKCRLPKDAIEERLKRYNAAT